MPEIPDLNIFRKNLVKGLVGKTLTDIKVIINRRLKVSEAVLNEALEKQVLTAIERIGKELHFKFKNGRILGLHLMLHGTMYWFEGTNENRFTIAELLFDDGTGLAITDWQKAVILTLDPKPVKVPDAMNLSANYLKKALVDNAHPIKTVLTDGKTVQGIGNAYVDEILYEAKISPFSTASKLPEDQIKILTKAIDTVLVNAENHISHNFPDTITEKERDFLQVHRPKQTLTLAGEEILKADIHNAKRTTPKVKDYMSNNKTYRTTVNDIQKFNLLWLCHAMTAPTRSHEQYYYDGKAKRFFYSKKSIAGVELFNMVDLNLTEIESKSLLSKLKDIDSETSEIVEIPRLDVQDKASIQLLFLSKFPGVIHEEELRLAVEQQPDAYGFKLDTITNKYDVLEPMAPYWEDFKLKTVQYYLENHKGVIGITLRLTQ